MVLSVPAHSGPPRCRALLLGVGGEVFLLLSCSPRSVFFYALVGHRSSQCARKQPHQVEGLRSSEGFRHRRACVFSLSVLKAHFLPCMRTSEPTVGEGDVSWEVVPSFLPRSRRVLRDELGAHSIFSLRQPLLQRNGHG